MIVEKMLVACARTPPANGVHIANAAGGMGFSFVGLGNHPNTRSERHRWGGCP
jgi:hypothetical protein